MDRYVLRVNELSGPSWDPALDLLESGEARVALDQVQLWRSTAGPEADGQICITVEVGEDASGEVAREAMRGAHETVTAVAATNERFANLLLERRPRWEVVHDYGMGTNLGASEDEDGNLIGPNGERL
jgi:hypothetical protein